MITYLYKATDSSRERGYNRTITVYRMKRNIPHFLGTDDRINTASYKGDYAIACGIISLIDNHELDYGHYRLKNEEKFQVLEV